MLASCLLGSFSGVVNSADYSDGDIHKNDYKWTQFNLMYAANQQPTSSDHDYMEMEFGGRSGLFDLYSYVDVFNLTTDSGSDKSGADKLFMKFAPRVSMDALTGIDMSFGPIQELYIASLLEWDGGNDPWSVNNQKIGIGSDVMVPWLGKVGLNLYKIYEGTSKDWNGYHLATNWFKPFYFFENGSFLSYQGYIDYEFGKKESATTTSSGLGWFNGLYWHSERYAVGYGMKLFKDVYGLKDRPGFDASGVGHYFAVTYKF